MVTSNATFFSISGTPVISAVGGYGVYMHGMATGYGIVVKCEVLDGICWNLEYNITF